MLPKFSVKKPYTVFVGVILVIVLGVVAFTKMTPDLLPSIDLPYVIVYTTYPGASPEQVESTITKPVEAAMATLEKIDSVSSRSSENLSMVILEFGDDVNMDAVTIDIREKLDGVSGSWPDMVSTPHIMKINPDMLPVMVAAVDMDGMDTVALSTFVNDTVYPRLEGVTGVAGIDVSGAVTETIRVDIRQDKIDTVNSRLYAAVNGKLADAAAELESGKADFAAAKKQLEDGLAEGSAKLAQTSAQLTDQLATVDAGISTITASKAELAQKRQASEAQRAAALAAMNLTPEQQVDLDAITALAAASGGTPDPSLLTPTQLALLGTIGPSLPGYLTPALEVMGYDAALASLDGQLAQLNDGRTQLIAGMEELEKAKLTAGMEGAVGKVQLADAEAKLKEAESAFNSQRDSALSAANIDDIVTADMISNILTAQNFSMPAGYLYDGNGTQFMVRVGDKLADTSEMEGLLLFDMGLDGLGPVYLSDVADVSTVNDAGESYAKINGNDGVILSFTKQSNYATAEVSANLATRFEELSAAYPGLSFTPLMDQGDYIHIIVDSVLQNLLMGAILAVLILFLFLKDIRPTIIIACSIPFSVIFAIVLMYFSGVTLNVISLSGLAVGVGMLVDNSVVVIENIYRLRATGASALRAAVSGAVQVAGAITASTLTTVCVFLPIVFVEGLTRQLFTDMALTIGYSLMASLIVALTLVPAMAEGMLRKTGTKKSRLLDKLLSAYEKSLRFTLRFKWAALVLAFGLLGFSMWTAISRGFTFMPDMETPQISVALTAPENTSFADTAALSDKALSRIEAIQGVDTVGATMGGGSIASLSGGMAGGSGVTMYVLLEDGADGAAISEEIEKVCEDLPGTLTASNKSDVSSMMSAMSGSGVVINLYNNDLDDLRQAAQTVAENLALVEGIAETDSGVEKTTPTLHITVDKTAAMKNGLTVAQVYAAVAEALKTEVTSTTLEKKSNSYTIVVAKPDDDPTTAENMGALLLTGKNVANGEETQVRLDEICTVTRGQSLNSISRSEQRRTIAVSGTLAAGYNVSLVSAAAEKAMKNVALPAGTVVEFAGENQTIMDAMEQLLLMLLLAVICIYLIMVAQFQSLLSPFVVMFTIPLAFTGGLLVLLACGMEVSVISMIGFIMLAGIIVNNGIVLIDYIIQLRAEGADRVEAIVTAGVTRMRPILMTVLTTVLGLSTMALGLGTGAALMQPIAIVCIGGLIYATFMTLYIVPVVYDLLGRRPPRVVKKDDLNILED